MDMITKTCKNARRAVDPSMEQPKMPATSIDDTGASIAAQNDLSPMSRICGKVDHSFNTGISATVGHLRSRDLNANGGTTMTRARPDMMLLFSDSRGQYIPQNFAKEMSRDHVHGVSDEDWAILEAGPEHEWYWDAWSDVEQNATITDDDGVTYTLYQNGDVWLVPVGMEWSDEEGTFVWPESEPLHIRIVSRGEGKPWQLCLMFDCRAAEAFVIFEGDIEDVMLLAVDIIKDVNVEWY